MDVAHDEVPDPADFTEGVQGQDARMRQLRGDLGLTTETLANLRRVREVGSQHLDGDEAVERPLAREVDIAHPPMPQRPHDLILLTECGGEDGLLGGRTAEGGIDLTWLARRVEQRLDLITQRLVALAGLIEPCGPLRPVDFHRRRQDVLHFLPALGRHEASSRLSQARAVAHSRLMVLGEHSISAAVSSMERPPKYRSSTILA